MQPGSIRRAWDHLLQRVSWLTCPKHRGTALCGVPRTLTSCSPPPNAVVDGLAALAAWVLPPSTLLGLPSHSFATTAVAVHILPHLLGGKLHEVVTADVHELVLSVALWGLVNTVETTFPPAVGPAAWLAFYHLNTALTLVRRTLSGTRSSLALTDHPAHFFGTLTVVPFAALLTSTPCQAPLAIKMTLGFLGCRAILSV